MCLLTFQLLGPHTNSCHARPPPPPPSCCVFVVLPTYPGSSQCPAACSLPYSCYLRPVMQCMLTDVTLGVGPALMSTLSVVEVMEHAVTGQSSLQTILHDITSASDPHPPPPPPPPSSPQHDQLTQMLCGWQTTVPFFFTSPCTWGYTPGQTRHSYMN